MWDIKHVASGGMYVGHGCDNYLQGSWRVANIYGGYQRNFCHLAHDISDLSCGEFGVSNGFTSCKWVRANLWRLMVACVASTVLLQVAR